MLDGRIMCLDLGQRRIGVAVSDMLGYTAQGLCVVEAKSVREDIETIKKLAKEQNVNKLIIGFPLNLDGSAGSKAQSVKAQYEEYKAAFDFDVLLRDERFSTKQAERVLSEDKAHWKKKREVVDIMAAQIILQSYLDTLKKENVMDENRTLLFTDEDGVEKEFIIDDEFEFEGGVYMVLCESDESEDAMLVRVEEDEDGEILVCEVDDDDEFERVSAYYFDIDNDEE